MAELSLDAYWQLPALSRNLATFTFLLSLGINTGLIDGGYFMYFSPLVWRIPPQLWRLVTSFCITGSGLSILFDTYFLYNFLSSLETGHPRLRRKEDLIWYLIFVGSVILGLNHGVGLYPFPTFLKPLTVAMAYTATQQQQGLKINYMFINIPAPMMPYAMIGINFFFPGGYLNAIFEVYGLIAAHLYEFLTKVWPDVAGGVNLLATPGILSTIVNYVQTRPQVARREYGTAFTPGTATSGSSTGSSTSPPLPDAWRTRGPGRRLG